MNLENGRKIKTVSVLVPVYNEEQTVGKVIQKLNRLDFISQIVVVDDFSTDNSFNVINSFVIPRLKIIRHEKNSGKTEAIKTAVKHANGEIVVIQDADLEYDPNELESVVLPIINGHADVVYGSRFLVKRASRVLYYSHYIANKFLTILSNIFTNYNMTDIETGYKAFLSPILKEMPLTSKGFGMEVEITATIAKLKARVYETPISYYGRTYEEGKKIIWIDGVMAIWYVFKYNLFSGFNSQKKNYLKKIRGILKENNNGTNY